MECPNMKDFLKGIHSFKIIRPHIFEFRNFGVFEP